MLRKSSLLCCKETSKFINAWRVYSQMVEACASPKMSYCSRAIFPGLFKRWIKLIIHVCGLSFSYVTKFVFESHFKESSDFAAQTISTPCTGTCQRQGQTPPPEAVSSCYRNSVRHIHDFWLTETRNRVSARRSCLDVYLLPPFLIILLF